MNITQNGDKVTIFFGGFPGGIGTPLFKGKVGNNFFTGVVWDQNAPDETKVIWGKVLLNGRSLSGKVIYPRVSARSDPPPGSPRLVPGYTELTFTAVKQVQGTAATQTWHTETADDPNEPAISDGKDWENLMLSMRPGDAKLFVRIHTYADRAFTGPFESLYFTGGEKGQLHVMLTPTKFQVLGPAPGQPGLFNVLLAEGTPLNRDKRYYFHIPWQEAFGNSQEVEAWLFSQDERDRVPDGLVKLKFRKP